MAAYAQGCRFVSNSKKGVNHNVNNQGIKGPKNDSSIRKVPVLEPIKKYFTDKNQAGYVVTSADGLLCTQSAWDRGWESYISELETALNGCCKRWYHLTREWKTEHPDEYDHSILNVIG